MYPFRFLGHTTQRLRPGRGFLSACRSVRPSARKDRKDQRRFHGGEAYNTLRQTFVLIGTTPRVTGNSAVKPLGKGCRQSAQRLTSHNPVSGAGGAENLLK